MTEVLASQAQQSGNNTVIVSDTLGNIGGGNIGDGSNGVGDTYAGRLLIIDQDLAGEQIRFCISDAAGTGTTRILTVSEDWDVNPVVTTDSIWVPYELADIEDGGASGGISLSSKTGLWELSNTLKINSTGNLFVGNGQGLEIDDRGSTVGFEAQSGGWFYCGYELAGASVNGAVITSYNNTLGEPNFQAQSGGHVRMFDTVMWAQLVAQQWENANGCDAKYNECKFLSNTDELHLYDSALDNCSASGRGASTQIVRVDAGSMVTSSMILSAVEVLDSVADTAAETIELENVQFVNVPGFVDVRQNKTWNLIDPVWLVTTYTELTWSGTSTGNELNDRRSIRPVVQEADGTKLQNALVNVYEDTVLADLVLELVTDGDGLADDSFIYKKHATNSVTTTYGGHALQCGKWLYTPIVFTQISTEAFAGSIVLGLDSNIVETTQATALTNGSGITWNEDTNPSEIFEFTTGVNTLGVGETLTFSPSGATGIVTEIIEGDSVAGTVHLKTRNATAIANNDTIASSATWTGTYTNDTKQPFTIWIDGVTKSFQTIYDYFAALTTETTLSATGELVWEWCRDTQSQILYLTGAGFSTEDSSSKGVIVVNGGAGTVQHFTDDAGATWVPPVSVTLQVTVIDDADDSLLENVQTSLYVDETPPRTELMNEDTNASGIASEAYAYVGDVQAILKCRKSEDTDSPRYEGFSQIVTIDSGGLTQTVRLKQQTIPI